MKTKAFKALNTMLFLYVLIFFSGCGCPQYSESGQLPPAVEIVSSKNVKIIWADSHQVDGNLIVHGTLRRQARGSVPMKAHIDVQIVSKNGMVIQEVRTEDIYLPRYQTGKGIKFERFEIVVKDVPLDTATVLVSAHQRNHDA